MWAMVRATLAGLCLWLLLLVITGQVLRAETIECRAEDFHCANEVVYSFNHLKHQSLFWYSYQNSVAQALSQYPNYQFTGVTKEWPQTVVVNVERAPLVYILQDATSQRRVGVDAEARLTWDVEVQPQLTTIVISNVESHVQQPNFASLWHRPVSELLSESGRQQLTLNNFTWSNEQLIAQTTDNKRIIFDLQQPQLEVVRLKMLLQDFDFSQVPTPVNEIDVRFKFPVLRS